MAFVPVINFCLEKDNEDIYQLSIDDITDVYDASSNTTGWEDASTLLAANVTAATLTITDPDSNSTVIDVLSQIPNPVTGNINFTDVGSDEGITMKDGLYKIVYTITDGSVTWTDCVQKYFYPNVKCCISKLIKKLENDLDNKTLWNDVTEVKALEFVLASAAKSLDASTADKMLALLEDYCNYNSCNCK